MLLIKTYGSKKSVSYEEGCSKYFKVLPNWLLVKALKSQQKNCTKEENAFVKLQGKMGTVKTARSWLSQLLR
jgi:hypothetical protein